MNRTIYILIAFICFCIGIGFYFVFYSDSLRSSETGQNTVDTVETSRGLHKIGNKTLIEYIEKFDQKYGQGPEFADRGIAIYCYSYIGQGLNVDSVRYDITYNIINNLPVAPFILCESINGRPVVVYFPSIQHKLLGDFYMPAGEALEALKGTIPEGEYKKVLDRMREIRKLNPEMTEDQEIFLICVSSFPEYRLVFDKDQKLLRFTKSWY